MMNKLWAPWRIKYILDTRKKGCIFCDFSSRPSKDRSNHVLYRGKKNYVVMNIFPYNNGHLMIVPYGHFKDLQELNAAQLAEMMCLLKHANKILKSVLRPEGFNVGLNIGKNAGAGIAGHLHLHIVPRWAGDTNFMPVLSDTKIISQSIEELYEILRQKFNTGEKNER